MTSTNLKIIASVVVFFVLAPLWANAKSLNRVVKSGRSEVIHGFFLIDEIDCSIYAFPKASIKQPAHGKITVKKFRMKLAGGKWEAHHCKGMSARGLRVIYRSNRGYRGPDKGKVYFRYPIYDDSIMHDGATSYTYDIKVK